MFDNVFLSNCGAQYIHRATLWYGGSICGSFRLIASSMQEAAAINRNVPFPTRKEKEARTGALIVNAD